MLLPHVAKTVSNLVEVFKIDKKLIRLKLNYFHLGLYLLSEILHIDTISIKVEPKHQPFLGRALVNDKKFLKIWKCLIHERGIRRFFVLFQIFSGFFSKQEFQAKGRLIDQKRFVSLEKHTDRWSYSFSAIIYVCLLTCLRKKFLLYYCENIHYSAVVDMHLSFLFSGFF
jgi:hypothetical protein